VQADSDFESDDSSFKDEKNIDLRNESSMVNVDTPDNYFEQLMIPNMKVKYFLPTDQNSSSLKKSEVSNSAY